MAKVVATGPTPPAPGLLSGAGAGFGPAFLQQLQQLQAEKKAEKERAQREQFNQLLIQGMQGTPGTPATGMALPGVTPTGVNVPMGGAPGVAPLSIKDAFAQAMEIAGDPGVDPSAIISLFQPSKPQVVQAGASVFQDGQLVATAPPKPTDVQNDLIGTGLVRGTPEFQAALKAEMKARAGSTTEFERLLATQPDDVKTSMITARLNHLMGVSKSQLTELQKNVAAATGMDPGTPAFQKEMKRQLDGKLAQQSSTVERMIKLMPTEEQDKFRRDYLANVSELTEDDEGPGKLLDVQGNVTPTTSNSVRASVTTGFGGIFDPTTGNVTGVKKEDAGNLIAVASTADTLLQTGQEKTVNNAVAAAFRAHDIPIASPQISAPGVTTPTVTGDIPVPTDFTVPQREGVSGSGQSREDPIVGLTRAEAQALPPGVWIVFTARGDVSQTKAR